MPVAEPRPLKKPRKKPDRPALGGQRDGVALDVVNEEVITLREAAALSCFLTNGNPATNATMNAHRKRGLECMWTPRGWKTSKQAVQRYFEKLNHAAPVAKKKASRTAHNAATAALDAARI